MSVGKEPVETNATTPTPPTVQVKNVNDFTRVSQLAGTIATAVFLAYGTYQNSLRDSKVVPVAVVDEAPPTEFEVKTNKRLDAIEKDVLEIKAFDHAFGQTNTDVLKKLDQIIDNLPKKK